FTQPFAKLTPAQQQLFKSNPKLNINPGVLYQYNQAAADELKKISARFNVKRAEKPPEDFLAVMAEVPGQVPPTRIFHRGDYRQPKSEVMPGDLSIAAPDGQRLDLPGKDKTLPGTGRRLAFARHLTSGRHPLVGRV